MDKRNLRDLLSAYLDGELSEAELRFVEQQLVRDGGWATEMADLRQVVALMNRLPTEPAPRNSWGRIRAQLTPTLDKPTFEMAMDSSITPHVQQPAPQGLPVGQEIVHPPLAEEFLEILPLETDSMGVGEILSAYLDDELLWAERERVETRLLSQPEWRADLAGLRQIILTLNELDQEPVPPSFNEQVRAALRLNQARSENQAESLSENSDSLPAYQSQKRPFREMLSAFLDGAVDSRRRRYVRRRLARCAATRRALKEYQQVQGLLHELPRENAPLHFSTQMLDRLRQEHVAVQTNVQSHTFSEARESPVMPAMPVTANNRKFLTTIIKTSLKSRATSNPAAAPQKPSPPKPRRMGYRMIGVACAVAAALLVGIYLPSWDTEDLGRVAGVEPEGRELPKINRETRPKANRPQVVVATHAPRRLEAPAALPLPVVPLPPEPDPEPADHNMGADEGENVLVQAGSPLHRLADVKPGELVEIDRIEFVCVDVQRMVDRLRLVLIDNQVLVTPDDGDRTGGLRTYEIAVCTSPHRMQEIFADLWRVEENYDALVAAMEVSNRPPQAVVAEQPLPKITRDHAMVFVRPLSVPPMVQPQRPTVAKGPMTRQRRRWDKIEKLDKVEKKSTITEAIPLPQPSTKSDIAQTAPQPEVPAAKVAAQPIPAEVRVVFVVRPTT